MTQPQPGELDERLARAPVAGLADALLTARAATGIGTGCQARIGRHVAAVGEVAVEDFQLQHGCDLRADAFQPQQRRELGAALLARLRRARVAHGLDLGQVAHYELEAVELPTDLRRELARQRAAVPGHEPGQTFAAIRPERLVVVDPLRRAQALDPVAEPQALLEQRPSLAAEAALVLVLRRGRTHHGADLPLAARPGHQGPQQRLRIQPIGLRAPGTAVDLQRGRVHDVAHNPLGLEHAVQPEPVAAGLVAARDAWRRAEPPRDAGLGAGDQAKHLSGDACRQTMTLDLVGLGCVQSYEPARAAQLKGEEDRVDADRLRGRIGVGGHGRSPVSARGEDHQTSPARPSGAHEIFYVRIPGPPAPRTRSLPGATSAPQRAEPRSPGYASCR